jgi:hypothetical protein
MREMIALALLCLLLAVGSLAVLAWAAVSTPILSLDGLLLAAICLTLAAVFGFCSLWLARDIGLVEMLKSRRAGAANPEKTDDKQ